MKIKEFELTCLLIKNVCTGKYLVIKKYSIDKYKKKICI